MAAMLTRFRGGLALVGPPIDDAARACRVSENATTMPYHITLVTKKEYRSKFASIDDGDVATDQLYFLGLGGAERKSVYWVVCVWAAGAAWRKAHGLPPLDFHITLSGTDVHHRVARDASSLLHPNELTSAFPEFSAQKQDHVLDYLFSIRSHLTLPLTISDAVADPHSAKRFVRLGDASVTDNPKLSMLAYARALSLDPSLYAYVARCFSRLAALTHYGPLMTLTERDSMPPEIREVLLRDPWCPEARRIGHDLIPLEPPTLVADRYDRLWFGDRCDLQFFSWIVPYFLAAGSEIGAIRTLTGEIGVNRILSLTEKEPLPASWFAYTGVKYVFLPVVNYEAPTFKEVDWFIGAVTEEETIWLVHCGSGMWRGDRFLKCWADVFLACYIASYGFQKPALTTSKPVCDPETAIRWLRSMRKTDICRRCIESTQQERFVADYVRYRWELKTEEVVEPTAPMSITGRIPEHPEHPELVMLVGLPGSGKSWFSSALAKRKGVAVDVVSQDESGSRARCEDAVSRRRSGTMVILDRCNPAANERREWLALADVGDNAIAVYFDVDDVTCTRRIDRRIQHPTLRIDESTNAMNQMKHLIRKPTLSEGFSAVITIPSFDAARQAVKLLGGTPPLVKFPRTQHLINLGAATRDDLILNQVDLNHFEVVLEEKIDGANMGISLDYNRSLVVQNRSHTVNSRSHARFRRLDEWLERHAQDLHSILDRDDEFPERYILYGEWVVATHSIAYSELPDVFLAFDFYDRVTNTYISRMMLARLLEGTGIQQVPLIATLDDGVARDQLLALMTHTSAFYDGPLEGVYVRFEDDERLLTVDRGKVVRAGFIAGSEHWSKGIVKFNGIAPSTT